MMTKPDPAEVKERDGQNDRAMATHPKHGPGVEVDHAGHAGRVDRFDEQRADHRDLTARFENDRTAEVAMVLSQPPRAFLNGA